MIAMKRTMLIFFFVVAFTGSLTSQVKRLGNTWTQSIDKQQSAPTTTLISNSDPIIKRDTIIVEKVIKRTEVIYRTEEVIDSIIPADYSRNTHTTDTTNIVNSNNPKSTGVPDAYGKIIITKPKTDIMETLGDEVIELTDTISERNGNYIWIPDSLKSQVRQLLKGGTVISNANQEEQPDMNEKVTFRGKTIPMILKDRNLGRYDRGLFNYLFIPKGIWQLGLTASYGEFSTANLEILDLVSDVDFNGHIFSIKPSVSYFVGNNSSIGLRFGYTAGTASIGSFNVDIDDDMSFNLHDIMYKSKNYTGSIVYTHYLGITRRGRFGIFNEVELALAGGSSDFHRPYGGELRRTHTNVFQAGLNFSPGISVYILEPLSFNVSFGVFGLNIKHEKQTVDDVPMGERTTSGANFRFNIFNINFGIAVNI